MQIPKYESALNIALHNVFDADDDNLFYWAVIQYELKQLREIANSDGLDYFRSYANEFADWFDKINEGMEQIE